MPLIRVLSLSLTSMLCLGAAELEPNGPSGFIIDVHTAIPVGTLAQDTHDQFGFGMSLGFQAAIGSHAAFRGTFKWTGYRVNDRNLAQRFLANILDSGYDEDRLILRSYAFGGDFVGYQNEGGLGPYILLGGGLQRSRMYYEHRAVDSQGTETTQGLAAWPAAVTPYLNAGMGYQGRSGFFVEGRVVAWRYRAEAGVPLMQTTLNAPNQLREATSLVAALGVRF